MIYEQIVKAVNEFEPEALRKNDAFFVNKGEQRQAFEDNIRLDYMTLLIDRDANMNITAASAKRVYAAAKTIFGLHPDHAMTYDASSAWDTFGSPWARQCDSPEEWVCCYLRRLADPHECYVEDEDVTPELVNDVLGCIAILKELGVAETQPYLLMLCHNNALLEEQVTTAYIKG